MDGIMRRRTVFVGLLMVATLLTFGLSGRAFAATVATLDPSFGSGGSVTTDFGGTDQAYDSAVMPDGRIVVLGDSNGRVALARYLPSGALDTTFNGTGKVVTAGYTGYDLALQPDGKILVWGSALLRYTSAGVLDSSFGSKGVVKPGDSTSSPLFGDVVVRHDGTIATLADSLILYSSSGQVTASSLDVNGDGADFNTLAEQSSGALVAAAAADCGCSFLGRWTAPNLVDDSAYEQASVGGPSGVDAFQVFALPGNRMLSVSQYYTDQPYDNVFPGISFERYLPSGAPDTSFGPGGVVFTDTTKWPSGTATGTPIASALTPSGQIVVLGTNYVARFTAAGALDKSFSGDGILRLSGPSWASVAVQSDGNILVVGSSGGNVVIKRYLGAATVTRDPAAAALESGGGTLVAGNAASLAAADGNTLQVRSTTSGTTRTSSWSATFNAVPNTLGALKISWTGKETIPTTQTLLIWNYTNSTWTTVDTRTVGTSAVTISNHAVGGTAADYVSGTSGNGTVKIRLTNTAAANHTAATDRLTISHT